MFSSIKKKLRTRNILLSIVYLAATALFSVVSFSIGFNSDSDWQIGLRGAKSGIPLPNWIFATLILVLALVFLCLLISSVADIAKNKTYNKFLEEAGKLGELSGIERFLSSMQKSALNKGGDLRYNQTLFFYMKGGNICLFPTKQITSIRPVITTGRNSEIYVEVRTADKTVKVFTKKSYLQPLANDMLAAKQVAQ